MRAVSLRRGGFDRLRRMLDGLPAAARAAAAPALDAVASQAAQDVRAALADPARAGALAGTHRRSAPGEAPADPTGALAAAVGAAPGAKIGSVSVVVDVPYARWLEFGTVRTAARPFLRPAALAAGHRATASLGTALRRGLSQHGQRP